MKKRALKKEFRMEVKKSLNRFISIFFIVAMGVAFFSGIQACAPDMRATGDYYFDQNRLMDIRVISTMGLTDDDLDAIRAVEGVEHVTGCYMEDVYRGEGDSEQVLHIESMAAPLNLLSPEEGRIPEKEGECFLDASYALGNGCQVGDILEIEVSSEEDSLLKRREFVIVGYGYSPTYISFERGSTTLGTGSLSGFVYVLPEEFDSEVYTTAYISADGAREAVSYTDEYNDLVECVYDRLEAISDARCEIRYDEVMSEAQETLDEARQEVEEGKQELEDAKQELADGKAEMESEISEAESELTDGEEQLEEGKQELEDARAELEDGEKEIADGEAEIEENEQTLADAKRQLEEGRQTLNDAEAQYQSGWKEYQSSAKKGKEELQKAQKQLDDGKKQLESGWKEYYAGVEALEAGEVQLNVAEKQLNEGQAAYDASYDSAVAQLEAAEQQWSSGTAELEQNRKIYEAGVQELNARKQEYEAGRAQLDAGWAQYETGAAKLAEGQAAYEQGMAYAQQLQAACDGKAAEIQQIQNSCDNAVQEKALLEASLAEAQQNMTDLQEAYETGTAQLSGLQAAQNTADGEYQSLKNQLDQVSGEKQELQETKSKKESAYSQLQQEIEKKQENGEDCTVEQQQAEALQTEINTITGQITEVQTQIDSLTPQVSAAKAKAEEAKAAADQKSAELAQNRAAYEEACQMKEQLPGQISAKTEQISVFQESLTAAQTEHAGLKVQYEAVNTPLTEKKNELDQAAAQLAATKTMLDAQEQQMAEGKAALDAGTAELADAQLQIKAGEEQLASAKAQIDAGYAALNSAAAELAAGKAEIEKNKAELEKGKAEMKAARKTLKASEKELEAGQKQIDDGYAELEKAKKQLTSARKELDLGWAELRASQSQLADGERQLEEGREKLADAREELADARKQIADAEKEIEENEQKIKDGWEDYEEGKLKAEEEIADAEQKILDAEQEIADAEQEIKDAQEEIDDLKVPEWYVDDRSVLPENSGLGENAERIANLATVFPALFFLVAALISLTTMTRMVEEERTQIGTMKALGYSRKDIASKYIKYALYATLGGSLAGILFGEKVFPWVVITAYGMMYEYLPEIVIPYHWEYGVAATLIALVCTLGATMSACGRAMKSVPAELMRPPAPKEGKKVFLEYLPFIWKTLNFSWKSTVRNLMRYKKRCLMTVIGIGGCMGLLLVGYGLQDSIMDIGILQYKDLQKYDSMVILDTDASPEEQNAVRELLQNDSRVEASGVYMMQREDMKSGNGSDKKWSVYVYVPQDCGTAEDFFQFRDRETGETYELTDEGAIITEKVAKEYDVRPGDEIILQRDGEEEISVPIAAITENYMSHYLYMTPELYEKVYEKTPDYNCLLYKTKDGDDNVEAVGQELLNTDCVLNITYTASLEKQISHMLTAMDAVMIVLIVSAGLLAFVVLYNLNNININERRRELATLKVLGFFDGEVAAYVYRENILLTIVGAALGIFIGKFLHGFVITTVEVDACMFGRNINLDSFIYGTLFTVLFSVIVNYVMYFKLKKIDMVESLKSIE